MSLPTEERDAIAPTAPDLSLCWAVTSAPAVGSPVSHLDRAILFDDLHSAFDYAKYGSVDCTLVVWGVYGPNPVVAMAHNGRMFYQDDIPPTNHLRSAYPWVCPENGFSMEPGLTKREYFAGMALQGLLAGDVDSELFWEPEKVAEQAIKNADALLSRLAK